MCETLWNELMHNLSGIVKGARPIKGIKVTRYDVLFIIFPLRITQNLAKNNSIEFSTNTKNTMKSMELR